MCVIILDGFVVQLTFQLFVIGHFSYRFHEIFLDDIFPFSSDSKKTSLSAYVTQICTIEMIGQFDDGFIIDFTVFSYWSGMDFQYFQSEI